MHTPTPPGNTSLLFSQPFPFNYPPTHPLESTTLDNVRGKHGAITGNDMKRGKKASPRGGVGMSGGVTQVREVEKDVGTAGRAVNRGQRVGWLSEQILDGGQRANRDHRPVSAPSHQLRNSVCVCGRKCLTSSSSSTK